MSGDKRTLRVKENWRLGMNILNIIFFATMYPIVLVMYVVLRNLSGKEDGLLFGASMKKEWRSESEFVEIEQWYK